MGTLRRSQAAEGEVRFADAVEAVHSVREYNRRRREFGQPPEQVPALESFLEDRVRCVETGADDRWLRDAPADGEPGMCRVSRVGWVVTS
jgi:hypothetical protein